MSRSELGDYRARVYDAVEAGRAMLARLRPEAPAAGRGMVEDLAAVVAELAEAVRTVLGELERVRIGEAEARQDAGDVRAEAERLRQALALSRSRYAELADVALATLAALAHDEPTAGTHLEHVLEAHGHAPRLAKAQQCRHVLADPATWRRALEVA